MTVEGIVLAAGFSSRMGSFKPAMMLGEKSVVERAIDSLSPICTKVFVVGGHRIEELRAAVGDRIDAEILFNRDFEKGMFTSVKTGARAVSAERALILPCDIPTVKVQTCREILEIEADIVVPKYRGRKGHPVALSKKIIPDLLGRPDDFNLRDFIREIGLETVEVDDEGILLDMDVWEDFEILKRKI